MFLKYVGTISAGTHQQMHFLLNLKEFKIYINLLAPEFYI
jgi:hypothetical protein